MSRSFSSRLPLSRAEIDRDHLGRDAGIASILADPAARAIVLHDGKALLSGADSLAIVPTDGIPHNLALYLGRATGNAPDLPRGTPVVALILDEEQALQVGTLELIDDLADASAGWGDLRRLGARLGTRDAGLFTQALALANWHTSYAFSPRTGVPTAAEKGGWTRVDEDGREVFPRTDAAIIVGITDVDDRLLLGSNALWESNRYSLLAGFVEPGESLEHAVTREVFEESGVVVADPVYLGSQPWPFPASLMVGFRAHVPAGESTEPKPDGEEILALRWFTRDELASQAASGEIILPGRTSIARAIIEDWFGSEIDDGIDW